MSGDHWNRARGARAGPSAVSRAVVKVRSVRPQSWSTGWSRIPIFYPANAKMATKFGQYTSAVVCRIPDSFKDAIRLDDNSCGIDVGRARRQHEDFISILRKRLKLDVLELPADETCSDCVFVEDTAILLNGIALITKPAHHKRVKEIEQVRHVLHSTFKLKVVEIGDDEARLDGGDVIFTGNEFFVGISSRTNQSGARALAETFPDYRVSSVVVPGNVLHLGSVLGVPGPGILSVGKSEVCRTIMKQILQKAEFDYQTLTVPDDVAANCLHINGHVLHCSERDYPDSYREFQERLSGEYTCIPVDNSEFQKVAGSITCRVLQFLDPNRLKVK